MFAKEEVDETGDLFRLQASSVGNECVARQQWKT